MRLCSNSRTFAFSVLAVACFVGSSFPAAETSKEDVQHILQELKADLGAQKEELARRKRQLEEQRRTILQSARLIDLENAAPPLKPTAATRPPACAAATASTLQGLTAKHPLTYFYGSARFAIAESALPTMRDCAARGDGFSQLLLALDRTSHGESMGSVSKEWFLDAMLHVAYLGEPVGVRAAAHLIGLHLSDMAQEPKLFRGDRLTKLAQMASRHAYKLETLAEIPGDASEARRTVQTCAEMQLANTQAYEFGDASILEDYRKATARGEEVCAERGVDIYAYSRKPVYDAKWIAGLEDFSLVSGGKIYTAREIGRAFDGWKKFQRQNKGNVNFPDFILFTDDRGAHYVAGFEADPAKFGIREKHLFHVLRFDVGSLQEHARAMYDTARGLYGGTLIKEYSDHRDAAYSAQDAGFAFVRDHFKSYGGTWMSVESGLHAMRSEAEPFEQLLARLAPGTPQAVAGRPAQKEAGNPELQESAPVLAPETPKPKPKLDAGQLY
ncbi:MAG: hypothetical protein AAF661_07320 [Pseudomonadota bacterium]